MAKELEIIGEYPNEVFKVGKFRYTIDDNAVIVTKDTKHGLFETVSIYEYKDYETAAEMAYVMACKQTRA